MNAHAFVRTLTARQARMDVALVTETYPPEINGVAMTLGRTVDGLLRRGHRVQLIRPRQGTQDRAGRQAGFDEVLVDGLPIPKYQGLRFGLPAEWRLLDIWRQRRPDIVHVATEGPLGWSAVSAARALSLPVSSGFHTNFHNYSSHYGLHWLCRPISGYLRRFHNRTDVTLVPTRALAQELEALGYRNLAVVSRGVDAALFHPGRRSVRLRADWGVSERQRAAICVGRLAPEKNIALALEAYAAIRQEFPDMRMVFVGDGPLRAELAASWPEVVFAGARSGIDLAEHYASADLFLFPSTSETFGNVTTEALASGLAVVAYDYAAAADLIADGFSGRKVAVDNAAAFVAASLDLSCMADERLADLRAHAVAAVAHLDWERIHDDFANVLADTIGSRPTVDGDGKYAAVSLRP